MARAALGLSLNQLADLCGVSEKTIRRCEATWGIAQANEVTHERLLTTFEKHGILCTGSVETGVLGILVDIPCRSKFLKGTPTSEC